MMSTTKYREKVSKGNYLYWLILGLLIVGSSTIRTIFNARFVRNLIWYSVYMFVLLYLFFINLKTRFILAEDSLLCKGVFKTERIPYCSIKSAELYELSESISGFCDHYSEDIGMFYAIIYTGRSKAGVLIQTDAELIYGGKLFISPRRSDQFVVQLMERVKQAKLTCRVWNLEKPV